MSETFLFSQPKNAAHKPVCLAWRLTQCGRQLCLPKLRIVDQVNVIYTEVLELTVRANEQDKLVPTKEALEWLVPLYSNRAIGEIYGLSEAVARKRLKKFGVTRERRIVTGDLQDEELERIRGSLREQ